MAIKLNKFIIKGLSYINPQLNHAFFCKRFLTGIMSVGCFRLFFKSIHRLYLVVFLAPRTRVVSGCFLFPDLRFVSGCFSYRIRNCFQLFFSESKLRSQRPGLFSASRLSAAITKHPAHFSGERPLFSPVLGSRFSALRFSSFLLASFRLV